MFKKIQIIGHLGKDPERIELRDGGCLGKFSVAVNDPAYTNREGETVKPVMWFDIVAYQKGETGLVTSLICKYLHKGDLVFVDGEPTMRPWVAQDGSQRKSFEIKLGPQSTIKMLGGGRKREEGAEADDGFDGRHRDPKGNRASERAPAHSDDDIPF